MDVMQILSGLVVGLLVGITGVGGGSLMTPLLTLVFGYAPNVAVGTDLAFASTTKAFGTLAHGSMGQVRWDIVRRLCMGSLPAALVTIGFLHLVGPASPVLIKIMKWSIAISVLMTVVAIIFRQQLLSAIAHYKGYPLQGRALTRATIAVGAVIGVLVTISSIGAGAVGATLIFLLYPTLKPAEVAGTDIAYAVPLTALAAVGHLFLGNLNWGLLGGLLIGSVPGIWMGARLSKAMPEKWVRGALATTLTLVAFKMIS